MGEEKLNNASHKIFLNEPEVQFVSITVDPEVDNQKKLKEYSTFVGGDDGRWHFLWSDIGLSLIHI